MREWTQSVLIARTRGTAQTTTAAARQDYTKRKHLDQCKTSSERYPREIVLVEQHIIMRRPRRSEQSSVTLQVEIELGRVRDVTIDDSASRAVARPVCLVLRHGEEADVVSLSDDDDRNLRQRVDAQLLASVWKSYEFCTGLKSKRHTAQLWNLYTSMSAQNLIDLRLTYRGQGLAGTDPPRHRLKYAIH